MRKIWMSCILFSFYVNFLNAQLGKNGNFTTTTNTIVNQYYSVTSNINSGDNYVLVTPTPVLSTGDLVLIIQMQGASVNCYSNPSNTLVSLPNTSNYGAITNYNNAGNYEFAEVNSVSGNTVYLNCPVQKNYTASGKVQLIKVPRFANLVVNHTIYGSPWNGTTGGVIAIEVADTLQINSTGKISADTIGFRGGRTNLRSTSPSFGVLDMGHLDKNMGVYKGESIAGDTGVYATQFSGRFGKGAVANGGGGGNAVNAGGGGGANAGDTSNWNGKGNPDVSNPSWVTAWNLESPGFASNISSGGGRGGYTYSNSNKDPLVYGPNDYPNWGGDGRSNNGGLGGRPLDYASGRVFLGGGGGAGDADNNYGGRGGSGGGIIFILNYGRIIANGIITANGRDGYNTSTPTPNINDLTGRDGAGGGGGGGAIIIKTPNPVVGSPTVTAKGGNGGNQQMKSGYIFGSPNDAYGPGGGGGGGYIGSNVTIPNTNVSGGNNGIVQYLSGSNGCQIDNNFPPNGATKGGSGIVTNTLTPPELLSISPSTISVCIGSPVTATAISTNTNNTIFWYSSYTSTSSIATGSVLSLPAFSVAGTYTYYAGTCPGLYRGILTITVNPNPTITVNSSTICSGQSATLIASGASSYTWNTGATTSSIVVSPLSNTTYTVSGGVVGCTDTKTTQVIVNPNPTITVNSSTICSGQSATLIASGASSYTWNTGATTSSIVVSPLSNTTYTVSGSVVGCTDTKTTQVIVNPNPTITVNSSTICSGQSATLIASGASSYTWNTGALTSSIVVSPSSTSIYTVVGQINGCLDTKTTNVIVLTAPNLSITSTNSLVCQNNCISFTYLPSNYTNVQFNYGDGNGYVNTNSYCFNTIGIYTVVAKGTYTNMCLSVSPPFTINIIPIPTASFSIPSQAYSNESISIINTSTGAQLYVWNFGDSNTLSTYSTNINHSYSSEGTYCILLTAVDTVNYCSDTITKCISIQDNFSIEIPNAFTPNGDGTNDVFKVRSKSIKDFEGKIFDRWGVLLFEWNDVNTGWNGYLKNNAKAPTGTYFYLIKCTLLNGEVKEYKGYLTLME